MTSSFLQGLRLQTPHRAPPSGGARALCTGCAPANFEALKQNAPLVSDADPAIYRGYLDNTAEFIGWLGRRPLTWWVMTWFVMIVVVLTAIGILFRGPEWTWTWPWKEIY